jgi:hypothetical protein
MLAGRSGTSAKRAEDTTLSGPWIVNNLTSTGGGSQMVWTGTNWLASAERSPTAFLGYSSTGTVFTSATGTSYSLSNALNVIVAQTSSNVVATGYGQGIARSTTGGVSYSATSSLPGTFYPKDGVFFNGAYLISGTQSANQPVQVYGGTTIFGARFTGTINEASPSSAIAFSPTAVVMVSTSGAVRSTDGTSWNQVYTSSNTTETYSVAYGAGIFIAVGNAGQVLMSSDDGVTWVDQTSAVGLTSVLYSINYVNSKWLVAKAGTSVNTTDIVELT